MEQRSCICEECHYKYTVGSHWDDTRLCQSCRREVLRAIGEPARDCEPTPEELEYIAESLGVESVPDDQEKYGAYCNSCVSHGANRQDYPCLRKVCGWARRPTGGDFYPNSQRIQFATSTSNTTTTWIGNNNYVYVGYNGNYHYR